MASFVDVTGKSQEESPGCCLFVGAGLKSAKVLVVKRAADLR